MSTDEQAVFPHLRYIELHRDGVLYECAVLKEDLNTGDIYFIRIDQLDPIDCDRLRGILLKRDAAKYPLWDLLDQSTLKNGMNALDFFHQLAKVLTASGKIMNPGLGRMSAPKKMVRKAPAKAPAAPAAK